MVLLTSFFFSTNISDWTLHLRKSSAWNELLLPY